MSRAWWDFGRSPTDWSGGKSLRLLPLETADGYRRLDAAPDPALPLSRDVRLAAPLDRRRDPPTGARHRGDPRCHGRRSGRPGLLSAWSAPHQSGAAALIALLAAFVPRAAWRASIPPASTGVDYDRPALRTRGPRTEQALR